jgi:hypothetical protein
MRETISYRACVLFEQTRAEAKKEFLKVVNDHAARGLLASGATLKRFVSAHEATTLEALDRALESISLRVDSRGRRWRRMVADVESELSNHLSKSERLLKQMVGNYLSDGPRLADESLLPGVRERLHRHLSDYCQGWAGPPGKPWSERHKIVYSLFLIACGALLTKLVEAAFEHWWPLH